MVGRCSEEVAAILKPLYAHFFEVSSKQDVAGCVAVYTSDAVIVENSQKSFLGHDGIKGLYEHYFEKFGKVEFKTENEHHEGSENFLVLRADYTMEAEKAGHHAGKITHIWKQENGKWLIYFEAFTM